MSVSKNINGNTKLQSTIQVQKLKPTQILEVSYKTSLHEIVLGKSEHYQYFIDYEMTAAGKCQSDTQRTNIYVSLTLCVKVQWLCYLAQI